MTVFAAAGPAPGRASGARLHQSVEGAVDVGDVVLAQAVVAGKDDSRLHHAIGVREAFRIGSVRDVGEARLVQYNDFEVDAYPDGYVLILENADIPGVIGKVGARLGREGINIAQWRYGRDAPNGRAVSFINLDDRVPATILVELESEVEIRRARLVKL